MTDDTLRELARRWRTTGSPDDEAAWLAVRARRGGEDAARVELAAALDHAPAVMALGAADAGWAALRRLLLAEPSASPPEDGLVARLTLVTHTGLLRTITQDHPPLIIGRDPAVGMSVASPAISRRHARVRHVAGRGFVLDDVGSSSGTYRNQLRVAEAVLARGDLLHIGGVVVQVTALEHLPAEVIARAARDREQAEAWLGHMRVVAPELLQDSWLRIASAASFVRSWLPAAAERTLDVDAILAAATVLTRAGVRDVLVGPALHGPDAADPHG